MNSPLESTITTVFYKKYLEKSLASLYLISYDPKTVNPEMWALDFLKLITPIKDHPDTLSIHREKKSSEYKLDSESMDLFFNFLNYRPLSLDKKFLFLFEAQTLSHNLSHKLLKILEELPSTFCLFFMAPKNSTFLPTLESRAVKLEILAPSSSFIEKKELIDFKIFKTPQELLLFASKEEKTKEDFDFVKFEKEFIETKIAEALISPTYLKMERLLTDLADFETYSRFNHSKASRLTPFFP